MSKIQFNQPKYIFPLILLPFLCLFFWVYTLSAGDKKDPAKADQPGMQEQIGNASSDIQKKAFDDKLQAYTDQYKEADGYTAIGTIGEDGLPAGVNASDYTDHEKYQLDSIDRQMKSKFTGSGGLGSSNFPSVAGGAFVSGRSPELARQDQALAAALSGLNKPVSINGYPSNYSAYAPTVAPPAPVRAEKDPMEMFKAQMAYMDSVSKAADPEYKAEMKRQADLAKAEALRKSQVKLEVVKDAQYSSVFNTLMPGKPESFITAVIDENITGYAGSRIRLRLLEDIRAGQTLVKKGSYLYALISGFGDQRVTLTVQSILQEGKILPVKLDIYDADGLPGLYVPESAFREFTKDLGGNSMQGVNLQGSGAGNQFLMSGIDKVFQSTSAAIASLIRKNKAKVKYNSYIYLIDPEALQNAQKNY